MKLVLQLVLVYLSWIIEKPLISWFLFIRHDTFSHFMPHCISHGVQHTIQPNFNLGRKINEAFIIMMQTMLQSYKPNKLSWTD